MGCFRAMWRYDVSLMYRADINGAPVCTCALNQRCPGQQQSANHEGKYKESKTPASD